MELSKDRNYVGLALTFQRCKPHWCGTCAKVKKLTDGKKYNVVSFNATFNWIKIHSDAGQKAIFSARHFVEE